MDSRDAHLCIIYDVVLWQEYLNVVALILNCPGQSGHNISHTSHLHATHVVTI